MKNKVRTKGLSCLLCLAMMLSLVLGMSLSAQAAAATWSSNQTFSSSKTYNDEIIVTKSITLTLNGCDLTVNGGIYVQSGTLTITGGGKLYVQGKRNSANTMGHGIKGNVIVNNAGLHVSAADRGYGIQGSLEVNGADASADVYGGYGGDPQSSGVGSGGGTGISGNVTVNGGTLYVEGGSGGDGEYGVGTKKGGSGGAGIGGNVTIKGGGYVHAVGGSGGSGTGDYGNGGNGHYGIVGTLTATSGTAMVIGGDGGDGYSSIAPNAACHGAITAGFRKESSTGDSWKDISGDTSTLQYVKVEGHAHHFNYTASGATITAVCDAEDCLLAGRTASLTLHAPTGSLIADGSIKAATISGEIPQVGTPGISYTKDGVAVAASQVKDAGNYVASIAIGDAVASVTFTIMRPTYIITIPTKLDAKGSGYNATDGISASGEILASQKVVVTASSANNWKLKNGNNTISYYLTTAEDGPKTTQWTFYEDELAETITKPLGAVVEECSRKPSGEYADTVTFSARLNSIYTQRQVWVASELYNAVEGGATSFTKDGFTLKCGKAYCQNDTVVISGGGTFSYDRGKITRIEIYTANTKGDGMPGICGSNGWVRTDYEYLDNDHTYVWIAWEGQPARSIAFNNGFPMQNSYVATIKITTVDDR